jgi:hypothetical protein
LNSPKMYSFRIVAIWEMSIFLKPGRDEEV